jgi:ketosteroid isomerase-like protein
VLQGKNAVDDTYAINVAKTEYREGFNTGNADRVLSAFAPEFRDTSDGRPSRYGKDGPVHLRRYLEELFAENETHLVVIIAAIVISGNLAIDYGWQELTLTPRNGGEVQTVKKRYLETWAKQPNGDWRISRYIDNNDLPDVVD